MIEFLRDAEIYDEVIRRRVPAAQKLLWIATADIKDLYVNKLSRLVPFLEVLSDLAERHVELRLLHAKEPGPRFRRDFDKYPNLIGGLERILCPRVHFKSVIIDGQFAFTGSANLTGAGMGAKSAGHRNFEEGIATDDAALVPKVMEHFDSVWRGEYCGACRRRQYCADYRALMGRE